MDGPFRRETRSLPRSDRGPGARAQTLGATRTLFRGTRIGRTVSGRLTRRFPRNRARRGTAPSRPLSAAGKAAVERAPRYFAGGGGTPGFVGPEGAGGAAGAGFAASPTTI